VLRTLQLLGGAQNSDQGKGDREEGWQQGAGRRGIEQGGESSGGSQSPPHAALCGAQDLIVCACACV